MKAGCDSLCLLLFLVPTEKRKQAPVQARQRRHEGADEGERERERGKQCAVYMRYLHLQKIIKCTFMAKKIEQDSKGLSTCSH